MNAIDMEPAERDPQAIRRTVLILFILMFVGGTAIWWKYQKQQEKDTVEVVEGRAPRIGRLTKNFAGVCQDGESRGLHDLEGKVWVVAPIVPNHPEENKIQLAKMKELAALYKGNENFHLVCISVANPHEYGYEKLNEIANEVGADIKQWWFMAAEEEAVIGFLKDHLKMAHIKERTGADAEKLGKLDIAAQIRIVDQSRRVRGEHQHFDFDFAHFKSEETKAALAADPELRARLKPDELEVAEFYLNMDAEWTKRMHKVIAYTFNETEKDEDPDYITAIVVVAAILGFVVFQIARLRRRGTI